jgi:hypothetical protein
VVWEQWSLPKHNFSLWLAMLGKLSTRDRLWFLSSDPLCSLCQNAYECHAHLFFNCVWSSSLWGKARSWLKIHSSMSTLNRVIRGLKNNKKRFGAENEKSLPLAYSVASWHGHCFVFNPRFSTKFIWETIARNCLPGSLVIWLLVWLCMLLCMLLFLPLDSCLWVNFISTFMF